LTAIAAAKTAMIIQLAEALEGHHCEAVVVTPTYLLVGYRGYSWKISVRADPELYLLQNLHKPNETALALLQRLTLQHVTAATHHATIHKVHTQHPSAGHVVRLLRIWLACHLLSNHYSVEVVELLVAHVYHTREPGSVVSGFLQVLHLLTKHDWARHALIVHPDHNTEVDNEVSVGKEGMTLVAPYGETLHGPERVVVFRTAALAKRSHQYLYDCMEQDGDWRGAFVESVSALHSFSILLRVDDDYVLDTSLSSTGLSSTQYLYHESALARLQGPKALRKRLYKNLNHEQVMVRTKTNKCVSPLEFEMSFQLTLVYIT
jgi:U3 small nucleolar RNA-associated protein 22